MLRRTLLFLSEREDFKNVLMKMPFSRQAAGRFVAGETSAEALAAARALNEAGFRVTLDLLGESVNEREEAEAATAAYRTSLAEIDESDPAFDSLHAAGFAIYSRQRIFRLDSIVEGKTVPDEEIWRSATDRDYIAIQSLYTNLVPVLVQQVEPPPSRYERGLVYWSQGELLGFLDLERGPQGTWVQPYFHPAAELDDNLLSGFLLGFSPSQRRPLFICVRSYQGGLSQSLKQLGFEPCSNQAVMVKRLAIPIRRPVLGKIPALDGTQPEPSAPFANILHHKSTPNKTHSL